MHYDPYKKQWSNSSLLELSLNRFSEIRTTKKISLKEKTVRKRDFFFLDQDNSTKIFNPENTFKIIWDGLILLITFCDALSIPAIISFPSIDTEDLRQAELYFCLLFLADVFVQLNTGFYHKGHLNSDRTSIFYEYLRGTLILDILSTAPLSLFIKTTDLIKYILILKLYRIFKLYKYFETLELLLRDLTIMKVFYYFRIILSVALVLHWLTCLWFYISYYDITNFPDTWAVLEGRYESLKIYLKCFYYVITTTSTLGYGDYHPLGMNQCIFALFILVVGVIIFSFNITSVINNVIDHRKKKIDYQEKMINLNVYMKQNNLPDFVKFKLRRYLEYVTKHNQKSKIKENEILALLSDPLREEIFGYTVAGKLITNCKVFTQLYEGKIIRKLSKFIQNKIFGPNDVVFEEGDYSSLIYFITVGNVEVSHKKTKTVFKILKPSNYFGEIGFFSKRKRTATIRCIKIVETLFLKRSELDAVLFKFPSAAEQTKKLELLCTNNDFSVLGVHCYLCGKSGHIASKCTNLRLSPDRLQITEKWIKAKSTPRAIKPRAYYHSNARRKYKSSKLVKFNIPGAADEESIKASSEYSDFMKKLSNRRLDTIREEEAFQHVENEDNAELGIERILPSEEDENLRAFNSEPHAKHKYSFSVMAYSEFADQEGTEDFGVIDLI